MSWDIHSLYDPWLRHFRARRLRLLYQRMDLTADTRVLDVGGHPGFWLCAQSQGLPLPKLTIANLRCDGDGVASIAFVRANGCALPFSDHAFEVAVSNSVIEHLGSTGAQARFAAEIRRVARRHFVQTPNRGFPLEPHLLTPFIHWLPAPWQLRLLRRATVWGWVARPTLAECRAFVSEVRLLDASELARLFPDSELLPERWLGLTKSLLAIGGAAR